LADNVIMKKFRMACIGLLAAASLWGGEYWVQVLSLHHNPAMDADFEKRLDATGFDYRSDRGPDGALKVRIGPFDSYMKAKEALHPIRCGLALDAFVVSPGAAPAVPMKMEVVPDALATVQPGTAAPEVSPATAISEAAPFETVAAVPAAPAAAPCTCICDKHALRKAEISAAIDYYRNAPGYRFEPEPSTPRF
jgi:hypothetical protein